MRPLVALATYDAAPKLAPDDQSLIPALRSCGIDAVPAVWSDAGMDWRSFDAVVIRSCWDYHRRLGEFHAWLAALEAARIPVFNSPALLRWNADKRYLLDLARRGVATIPTAIVARGRGADIPLIVVAEAWSRFVVKPVVSASGYETYALQMPLDAPSLEIIERVTSIGDAIVQPFVDEVPRDGEYSFTFIDGAFSHATIKRAATGEFRVQTEHGGSVATVDASAVQLAQAARVVAALPETPLYARVDGIMRGEAFLLMELELIEPNLFLDCKKGAADLMAQAVVKALDTRH